MKKAILVGLVSVMLMTMAVSVSAKQEKLNFGKELNPAQCSKTGAPVVNVKQKVVNDIDSGFGGYWAVDNYNREIQLWEQEDGSYCAIVKYNGKFDAGENKTAPNGMGVLSGDERGTLLGGYRGIINGNLSETPAWSTRGNVGTTDYDCNLDTATCTNQVDWIAQYFDNYTFSFDWWGWIYHGGKCGTWVNAQDGSTGNILCD